MTGATGSYQNRDNQTNRYTVAMQYDSIHNITRKQQVNDIANLGGNANTINANTYDLAYHYVSPKPHAASDAGPFSNLYDGNGNLIRRENRDNNQVRQIIWDEENRIACTQENKQAYLEQKPDSCVPSGSSNEGFYIYNAAGMRIYKNAGHRSYYVNQNFTEKGPNQFKHVFIGNQRLLTKKTENSPTKLEVLQWYAHGDHLSSTGYTTNAAGELQEYIGYSPHGEQLVREHPSQPVDYLFTGKEFDSETGYYYFGARYYDPRVSTWVSTDPAIQNEFLPKAGADGMRNLPGHGGVFNSRNMNAFAYVLQNPIIMIDPDGRWALIDDIVFSVGGGLIGLGARYAADAIRGQDSTWEDKAGAFIGGAVTGELSLYMGPIAAGAIGSLAGNASTQGFKNLSGEQSGFDFLSAGVETTVGALTGGLLKGLPIPGINSGSNSYNALAQQMITKFEKGAISSLRPQTAGKMYVGSAWESAAPMSSYLGARTSDAYTNVTTPGKYGGNGRTSNFGSPRSGGGSNQMQPLRFGLGVTPYVNEK